MNDVVPTSLLDAAQLVFCITLRRHEIETLHFGIDTTLLFADYQCQRRRGRCLAAPSFVHWSPM